MAKKENHNPVTFDELSTEYGFKWCPGCGNFGVLNTLKFMIVREKMDPTKIVIPSDIGQGGKLPMWLNTYAIHGLHGRALPLAQAIKIANPSLDVISILGDGGAYAEGAGHFVHACRRNVNITALVHNNATYALTTGQASPTTAQGTKTKTTPEGVFEIQFNPLQVAIASGATFVARAFAGHQEHFQEILTAAVKHKGFALIDVLQPCVIWNKVQTWQSWDERVYHVDKTKHDASDWHKAMKLAGPTWANRIPVGIFYQEKRPAFDEQMLQTIDKPIVDRDISNVNINPLLKDILGS